MTATPDQAEGRNWVGVREGIFTTKGVEMLVLSRKPGERIVIGVGDVQIDIEVLGFQKGRVRLGFAAPAEVKIVREELIEGEESE